MRSSVAMSVLGRIGMQIDRLAKPSIAGDRYPFVVARHLTVENALGFVP